MFDATNSVRAPAFQLALFPEVPDIHKRQDPEPDRSRLLPVVSRFPMLRELAEEVASAHLIPFRELVSESRRHVFAHPRQEFIWRARQVRTADGRRRYSLHALGSWFAKVRPNGKRMDHTTVLHAERRHAERVRAARLAAQRLENEASAALHGSH